jgi:hypothetical protein
MKSIGKRVFAALAVVLALLIPALTTAFVAFDETMAERAIPADMDRIPVYSASLVSDDVLWLARCIYSETKRAEEQELVAWVVRNRVETEYRGQDTYRAVVLDPYQFSAFNPGSRKRRLFMSLTPASTAQGWQSALHVAHEVYHTATRERPFPAETRHFYSEQSMRGRMRPVWADGETPVQAAGFTIDPRRFRFYTDIW